MERRRPAGRRADYRWFRVLTTRFSDNDALGHMNNAVHYTLFDATVCEWLAGKGLLDLTGPEVALVAETGCRYFSEMAFPDTVTAGLRVSHVGRSSVRYEIGLFRNDADEASAEGFFVHVHVDRRTGRPVAMSERRREALRELTLAEGRKEA